MPVAPGPGVRAEIGSNHLGLFVGIGLLGRFEGNTLTASGPYSFEAALGGGASRRQDTLTDSSGTPAPPLPQPAPEYGFLPDVSIGVGFDL